MNRHENPNRPCRSASRLSIAACTETSERRRWARRRRAAAGRAGERGGPARPAAAGPPESSCGIPVPQLRVQAHLAEQLVGWREPSFPSRRAALGAKGAADDGADLHGGGSATSTGPGRPCAPSGAGGAHPGAGTGGVMSVPSSTMVPASGIQQADGALPPRLTSRSLTRRPGPRFSPRPMVRSRFLDGAGGPAARAAGEPGSALLRPRISRAGPAAVAACASVAGGHAGSTSGASSGAQPRPAGTAGREVTRGAARGVPAAWPCTGR